MSGDPDDHADAEADRRDSPITTGETPAERINRELIEMLNELRVVLPGVQVLLAFLLAVPFTQRFASCTDFQRDVYFSTVALTVTTIVLLISPTAYLRFCFRSSQKGAILLIANRLTIVGIALLGLSLASVVVLITSLVYGTAATVAAGAAAMALMATFWFALPLRQRRLRP